MYLFTLDFWGILTLAFFASVLLVGYRLTWWLARLSEGLIYTLARTGMHELARRLLVALIDYDEHTYQQSRFIVWNQVPVRFALLWGGSLLTTLLILFLRIPDRAWMPVALIYIGYRLIKGWLTPARPMIHTNDADLKQLIQDVNEPGRPARSFAQPMIRRWDYLDALFAEGAR